MREDRSGSGNDQPIRFKCFPVSRVIGVDRADSRKQCGSRVTSVVAAPCCQAVCGCQLHGSQDYVVPDIKYLGIRGRFDEESDRFGRFLRIMRWLRFLPC